jgi:hypothetical protein
VFILFIYLSLLSPIHDWYEQSCCSNTHCHPVPDGTVTNTGAGVFVKGYGLLSYTDPRLRWSQNNSDHLCELPQTLGESESREMKLLCVYRRMPAT